MCKKNECLKQFQFFFSSYMFCLKAFKIYIMLLFIMKNVIMFVFKVTYIIYIQHVYTKYDDIVFKLNILQLLSCNTVFEVKNKMHLHCTYIQNYETICVQSIYIIYTKAKHEMRTTLRKIKMKRFSKISFILLFIIVLFFFVFLYKKNKMENFCALETYFYLY